MPGRPKVKGKVTKSVDERQPVKVSRDAYALARNLMAKASRHGWASLGVDREDPPSVMAIIDEALRRFGQTTNKKD